MFPISRISNRVTSWTWIRCSSPTPSMGRTLSRRHTAVQHCGSVQAGIQGAQAGALFSSYEWLKTNKYDKNNKIHVNVVDGIAEGNALPEVRTIEECIAAAKEVGFEVQYTIDRATTGGVPWQAAMKSARRAAYITHILTGVLEFVRFAPKGTQAVHTMLLKAAVNLEKGGDLGIFSPMYLIVMKKPSA